MPFVKANFRNAGNYSPAPVIHSYVTTDTQATVNTVGYFNAIAAEVRVGDLIYAWTDSAGTPAGFFFAINQDNGTTVDVTDGLALGTTDTD
jgi:hypothetical protein